MQITLSLPDDTENLLFCQKVRHDIKRNPLRRPKIHHQKNKKGNNVIFVMDDTIVIKHCVVVYKATGLPLLPQYEVKNGTIF
jgi:hypothetical protein